MKRTTTLKLLAALCSFAFCAASGHSQESKPSSRRLVTQESKSGSGEVTGFVFAITKAGDLKPARLAHVVLLYAHKNDIGPDDDWGPSATWEFIKAQIAAQGDLETRILKGTISYNTPLSDDQICMGDIQVYLDALKSVMEWAATEKKTGQVKTVDNDEEGHFKFDGLPPATYTVAVSGQAGMNMAYWEQDDVVVKPGETTSVKLTTPEQACLQP